MLDLQKQQKETLDVGNIIDNAGFNRVAVAVIVLCGLIMLMDGYDYTIISVAAPLIMEEWDVSQTGFSYAFSAAFFGYLFGAVVFGALADRVGRKPALIGAAIIFSVGTLLVYFTNSLSSLIAVRVFTGFGIGGAVPCAMTLTSEYAPAQQRGKYVSIMYSGMLIGIVLGGYLAGWMLERMGWRPLFLVGFFAPILVIVLLCLLLPESVRWLSARPLTPDGRTLLARVLPVIAPGAVVTDTTRFVVAAATHSRGSITNLFTGRLAWVTPLLWLYYLTSALAVFFIGSWAPQLLTLKGYTVSSAAYITGSINILVAAGCMLSGFYFDRVGFRNGAVLYIIAAVAVIFTGGMQAMAFVLLLLTGSFFINSAHMAVTILSPIIYPSSCRNLGGGVAVAAGRIGAIIGPILGGVLLDTRLPMETLLGAVAIPLTLSAVLCYITGRQYDKYFSLLYTGKISSQ